MAGYKDITLIAGSADKFSFTIEYKDGTVEDLSNYTAGKMTITDLSSADSLTIDTVTLGGTSGKVTVNIAKTDIPESFISKEQVDPYGIGRMTHAWTVWGDDTALLRGKASIVKAG